MANVELGKGVGNRDTVHIFHANPCRLHECPYKSPPYQCIRTNGDATIIFPHGVTRYTIYEIQQTAPCAR